MKEIYDKIQDINIILKRSFIDLGKPLAYQEVVEKSAKVLESSLFIIDTKRNCLGYGFTDSDNSYQDDINLQNFFIYQKISKAKDSVTKKAFQNWYWIVDILYELKDKNNMQYNTFNYDNPIAFAKENVVYILVVSEEKNIVDADKMRKCLLAGQKFQSDYMRKLEKYIFKEAYIYTPELLENNFVKHFKY